MNATFLLNTDGDFENFNLLDNRRLARYLRDETNFGRVFGEICRNPERFGLTGSGFRNDAATRQRVCEHLQA